MKCHVIVEGAADGEMFTRLFADFPLSERPRVVVAGGKSRCVSVARSILAIKREPVVVVVDADSSDPDTLAEQRAYLEFEMRAVSTPAAWKVFLMQPELESLLFSVSHAIERYFEVQLTPEQKVRAEYSPKTVLAGLDKQPWSVIELVQSLTEEELKQIRDRDEISEIRAFISSAAGTSSMARA